MPLLRHATRGRLVTLAVTLLTLGAAAGCGSDPSDGTIEPGDVASDAGGGDAGVEDTSTDAPDATEDGSPDVEDTSVDVDPDAENDAGGDTAVDATVDTALDVDATEDAGADVAIDAGDAGRDLVTAWGWYATGFELAAFVPDAEGQPDDLETCNVYVVDAGDDGETWWIEGGDGVGLGRVIYPGHPTRGFERMGRVQITGRLSELGTWGHFGAYERAIDIVRHELDLCGSVAETGHCLTPAPGDVCQFGVGWDGTLTTTASEDIPGVDDNRWHLAIQLIHGADIPDGETRLDVSFSVAQPEDWTDDARFAYPIDAVEFGRARETQFGVFVAEYDVVITDGWLVVDRDRDAIQYSFDLESDGGLLRRVWGDAVIGEVSIFP